MNEILYIVMTASIAYVFLFIIAKLLGKKQLAELNFIDYVTGISIGSIAAEMATDLERPLYLFLISMAIFFLFDLLATILERKTNFLKCFLRGKPLIVISKGKLDFKAVKKSKLDVYDILALARAKGYFSLDEIEYAIFETTGDLSILAADAARNVKKQDFPTIPNETPSLTYYMVVDKRISKYALQETQKSKKWVLEELSNQNIKLKDVMIATYNAEQDNLDVTTF